MPTELLQTARDVGGAEALLAVLFYTLLRFLQNTIVERLERIEKLCQGVKERQGEQDEKLGMLSERVSELEDAAQ